MEKSEVNYLSVSTQRRNVSTENRYRLIGIKGGNYGAIENSSYFNF